MNQPFHHTLQLVRRLDPVEQLRLAYCVLNGPIGDIITGEESAEHGIYNAETGLLALIEDRGGITEDIEG